MGCQTNIDYDVSASLVAKPSQITVFWRPWSANTRKLQCSGVPDSQPLVNYGVLAPLVANPLVNYCRTELQVVGGMAEPLRPQTRGNPNPNP